MMKKIVFLCVVLGIVLLNGCSIDSAEPNFFFVPLRITSVEMPESFSYRETHTISVTYERPNSCVTYEGFDINTDGGSIQYITCIGAEFNGEICTQAVYYGQANFEFQALNLETYTLKFWGGEDAQGNPIYLDYNVSVNN
ncbi:MAG: hypothetical protein HKN89_05215 [Eudoraea sp.]|nr:hypothetical protein [Eudoraea sp.]